MPKDIYKQLMKAQEQMLKAVDNKVKEDKKGTGYCKNCRQYYKNGEKTKEKAKGKVDTINVDSHK